jgi:exonuclease SbcD
MRLRQRHRDGSGRPCHGEPSRIASPVPVRVLVIPSASGGWSAYRGRRGVPENGDDGDGDVAGLTLQSAPYGESRSLSQVPPTIASAMKILHTSDWHLGRTFGPVPLHDVQTEFCAWLLDTAVEHGVELLVVAGDLYDRAIPPQESVVLWRDSLRAFHAAGIAVVAIAGNHDGADRVAAFDGLTDDARIFVRGGYDRAGEVLTLEFADGPLDIVAVPFLDPVLAPMEWNDALTADDLPRTHASVLRLALDRASDSPSGAARSIVVAHAFVTGSQTSDSERRLSIGTADEVPVDLFIGHSYVALGHLHRPQHVGATSIRYSGTPIPYSFSEDKPKSVVLVDIDAQGVTEVGTIDVPLGRPVATLTGTIDELLSSPEYEPFVDHFVFARLTGAEYVTDARNRLAERFPHVSEIKLLGADTASDDESSVENVTRSELEPIEAAVVFWSTVFGIEPDPAERGFLAEVFDAVTAHGAAE